MALDPAILSAGTEDGISVAMDDMGADGRVQLIKLVFGADGSFTIVSGSNGLPVAQQGTWTVDLGATDNAVLDAIATAAAAIQAAIEGTLDVAGTVNLGATDNAVLDAIQAAVEAIQASVAGTLTVGSHAVTNAGTFAVQVSSALPAGNNNVGDVDVASIAAGDNNIGNVDIVTVPADPFGANADAASATGSISAKLRFIASTGIPITGTVTVGSHAVTNAGTFAVQVSSIAAGNNNIGDVDVASIAAGTNLVGDVGIKPRTSGGLSTMNATSSDGATALTNSAQVIKASAGQLFGWYIYNPNAAAAAFIQFYNTAAASVTVGTTNPKFMLTIPAGAAANVFNSIGIDFNNAGWSWAATSTAGGNGALGTAVDAVAFYA